MDIKRLDDRYAVLAQLQPSDLEEIAREGFRSVVCHRPDAESDEQPAYQAIAAAARDAGLEVRHQPIAGTGVVDEQVGEFARMMDELPSPVLAFCRSGMRSGSIWALAQARNGLGDGALSAMVRAGFDVSTLVPRVRSMNPESDTKARRFDVVVVGAGAAGLAVTSSLLSRNADLQIALIEPADVHYYQPGWTLVGAGIFEASQTARPMQMLIPTGATRVHAAVTAFRPADNRVMLDDGGSVEYGRLVVCPGLELHWDGIDGLAETLGKNGVSSNYRYDLAPYTWRLVQQLQRGRAVFTQPPMPIKCAGAPQKAMYLSADHWRRSGRLGDIDVGFYNAGPVLFGVADYVPALMEYVERYDIGLNFGRNLVCVDGPGKRAQFRITDKDGAVTTEEVEFDMLHVCPPQRAPALVRDSELANDAGWVEVDQSTLRHARFENVWSLGDVCSAPNAKTAAAARKQAPVVADNLLADVAGKGAASHYDGYGSCPLTVEHGKIVLAEFGYGGKLLPSFPSWLLNGKRPSRAAWFLKERMLPPLYWQAMLKGREWLARPVPAGPTDTAK